MREILFRGKRADNGEWTEGQLLYFKASVGTEAFALIVESCEWDNANEWFNLGKRAKVIPETVGQFTGLTDKNGRKIFEGDIVKHYNRIYIGEPDSYIVVLIEWNEEEHRYQQRKKDGECFLVGKQCFFEIIGNIHDNPELLKGGEAE
jgi:uncharacterized phage protein (TIGR01671 family)